MTKASAQQSLFAVAGELDTAKPGSGALFSADRRYRLLLWRRWSIGPQMVICGVNPSIAAEEDNDHTVRRGMYYATREGCGAVYFVNCFGIVAQDPEVMKSRINPVDPLDEPGRCDRAILEACRGAKVFVAAWGIHGAHRNRDQEVLRLVRGQAKVMCFGVTKDGYPRHPSRLSNDVALIEYLGRAEHGK